LVAGIGISGSVMMFGKKVEVAQCARGSAQYPKSRHAGGNDAPLEDNAREAHDRLCEIERRLDLLSRGQTELQRTLILQDRAQAVSASNLMSHYGGDFLKVCYVHLLGRFPDPAGTATYQAKLRGGVSRRSILLQIYKSDEARSRGVRVRGILFLRVRDALSRLGRGGFSGSEKKVLLLNHLLRSDSSDFVVRCYREVLGRQPDLYGLDHYSTKVAKGTAKSRIIGDLAYSPEGKQRRVRVPGLWWRYMLAGALPPNALNSSPSA
jgi:hypothetical protein